MEKQLPLPVANADSAVYWKSANEEKLVIRRCNSCGEKHFMPRYLCPVCWSDDLVWIEASGKGTVHSFTVVRRASSPAFAGRTPYVVALIDLAEGPRMMTNIVGNGALEVRVGDGVRLEFEERDGAKLPQFSLEKVRS
ncbi:Zn-ribbon domain-containing OB-fold protein [Bradyrhizobium japonicum]|uniref:Zn-ribbon domain-containing OB-fold protein n=1 Tax=Bradyrhizobium japonicum TaxID=375 RepID=UPI000462CFE9|nr:Zn-ribbon domain-containing OB-fold protein [Bradyrhizobium japonicum]